MAVRAKFFVASVNHLHNGHNGTDQTAIVTLAPVYAGKDGNPANADWSKYTPSGKIEMTITNPKAHEQFAPGDNFFVTFENEEEYFGRVNPPTAD